MPYRTIVEFEWNENIDRAGFEAVMAGAGAGAGARAFAELKTMPGRPTPRQNVLAECDRRGRNAVADDPVPRVRAAAARAVTSLTIGKPLAR